MTINLLDLQPNVVSEDLKTYTLAFYGREATGKTTFAANIPKNLIIGAELGYKAFAGIYAIPATTWVEFLTVVGQLVSKPELKEKFEYVTIDTADALARLATEYVLESHNIQDLGEIEWGKGYTQVNNMIIKQIRRLLKHYTVIYLCHAEEKRDEVDEELKYATLALPKKITKFLKEDCDLIAYLDLPSRDGSKMSVAKTKSSVLYEAKSRFTYLPESIPFNFQNIKTAIAEAAKKEAQMKGQNTETHKVSYVNDNKNVSNVEFEEIRKRVKAKGDSFIMANQAYIGPVKQLINSALGGKSIAETSITDYEGLKLFEAELDNLIAEANLVNENQGVSEDENE